jgi:hypothetical protein
VCVVRYVYRRVYSCTGVCVGVVYSVQACRRADVWKKKRNRQGFGGSQGILGRSGRIPNDCNSAFRIYRHRACAGVSCVLF